MSLPTKKHFKYCKWVKNDSLQKNLGALISKEIRYSPANLFNDELDSKIIISPDDEISNKVQEQFQIFFYSTYKVASFTANDASSLMWAHYASNNTGYMLEYEDLMLHKITYSTNPIPKVDIDHFIKGLLIKEHHNSKSEAVLEFMRNDPLMKETSIRALTTKHIDWRYEDEYRGISNESQDGIKRKLSSITFGTRFKQNFISENGAKDTSNIIALLKILEKDIALSSLKMFKAEADLIDHKIKRIPITLKELETIIK